MYTSCIQPFDANHLFFKSYSRRANFRLIFVDKGLGKKMMMDWEMKNGFIDLSHTPGKLNIPVQKNNRIQRKRVLKRDEFVLGERRVLSPDSEHIKPQIKINKTEELIQQIEILCKCGEKIIIDLNYEE